MPPFNLLTEYQGKNTLECKSKFSDTSETHLISRINYPDRKIKTHYTITLRTRAQNAAIQQMQVLDE